MKIHTRRARSDHPFGAFCDMMIEHFPEYRSREKAFSGQRFAKALEFSHETIYRALREDRLLSVLVARRIMDFSRQGDTAKPLFWSDMVEFMLPDCAALWGKSPDSDADVADLLG